MPLSLLQWRFAKTHKWKVTCAQGILRAVSTQEFSRQAKLVSLDFPFECQPLAILFPNERCPLPFLLSWSNSPSPVQDIKFINERCGWWGWRAVCDDGRRLVHLWSSLPTTPTPPPAPRPPPPTPSLSLPETLSFHYHMLHWFLTMKTTRSMGSHTRTPPPPAQPMLENFGLVRTMKNMHPSPSLELLYRYFIENEKQLVANQHRTLALLSQPFCSLVVLRWDRGREGASDTGALRAFVVDFWFSCGVG